MVGVNNAVQFGIGAVVTIVFVALLVGLVTDTGVRDSATTTNLTAALEINSTQSASRVLALDDPYNGIDGILTVASAGMNATTVVNLTTSAGVKLCQLNSTSPYYCAVPAASITGSSLTIYINSTLAANSLANVTNLSLAYYSEATTDDWNPASMVMWLIVLPICLIAAAVIIFTQFA